MLLPVSEETSPSADELSKGMLYPYRSTDCYRTHSPNRKSNCFISSLTYITLMSCDITPLLIFNYSPQ